MKNLALTLCAIAALTAPAAASASPRAVAVLDTQARWVRAIDSRDAAALAKILAPSFVHVNYRGALEYREGALAAVKQSKPYKQKLTDETVDFAGDVAIVRGMNTVSQSGRIVLRLRYTDVYINEAGRWMALSAQETAVAR